MHCRASAAVAWLCVLLVSAFIAGSQAHTVEGVLKAGFPGGTTCLSWCKSSSGGVMYKECAKAYVVKSSGLSEGDCSKNYGTGLTIQCYCNTLVWTAASGSPAPITTTTTTTTKTLNCSTINRACTACQTQRISGTKKTDTVCTMCAAGWRLRQDGIFKTCDCSPGMTFNGTGTSWSNWCVGCPVGPYCTGGSADNPDATPTQCPTGLATIVVGSKSEAQCYTAPGYGRTTSAAPNGRTVVVVQLCPIGSYNSGGNTAGCQQCGVSLTTVQPGSTNISACVAPAGSYVYTGTARLCPKGTYTLDYNSLPACLSCPSGFTTLGEGSASLSQCDRVMPGYYIVNATYAAPCPLGSYQNTEGTVYSCSDCPYGWITHQDGAGGKAECMAPPGWELKNGSLVITECEVGWYKEGWNKAACLPCGVGLTTENVGSVSFDQCRVKPGWGLTSLSPLAAEPCTNNRYGDPAIRPVQANARCVLCPPNMFTLDVLKGINSTGYTSETACLVKPGWGLEQSGQVEMCQEGLFNEGYNREQCGACPAGYTSAATGADSPDACVVQEGWAEKNGIPAPCSAGTWSSGGTPEAPGGSCIPCGTGLTTQKDESTSASDCNVCQPGHGGENCTLCGYNTFSMGGHAAGINCTSCASGTVSARGSGDSSNCVPNMAHVDNDYRPLSDDQQWTADTATTAGGCEDSCQSNPLCALYRFSDTNTPRCQLLLETAGGEMVVGFKAGKGMDYALYKVPAGLEIGQLVSNLGTKTPHECMSACTSAGDCELVSMIVANLPGTPGPCKLYGSVYDADYTGGGYHMQGNRLYTDLLVQ